MWSNTTFWFIASTTYFAAPISSCLIASTNFDHILVRLMQNYRFQLETGWQMFVHTVKDEVSNILASRRNLIIPEVTNIDVNVLVIKRMQHMFLHHLLQVR